MLLAEIKNLDQWLLLFAVVSLIGCFVGYVLTSRRTRKRRRLLKTKALSLAQKRYLAEHWPLYDALPKDIQQRVDGWTQLFLAKVSFEACGELTEVTEEMRLLVAAQACLLLAGRRNHVFYPLLTTVLLYPGKYIVWEEDIDGTKSKKKGVRLGESWSQGVVVLGWEDVQRGAQRRDGLNLVLHEFAHQLDYDGGPADGAPCLEGMNAKYWQQVFQSAWEQFYQQRKRGKKSVLDDYAATNSAEFFAVAVETFFEKGAPLQQEFPDLYAILATWFACQPAKW